MAMNDSVRGVIVLFITALAAGGVLAQVYQVTAPKIAEQKRIDAERLNREIYPEAARFVVLQEGGIPCVQSLDATGKEIGRIYDIQAPGYGGPIALKVGISPDSRISRVKVVSQSETPGLGTKITGESFLRQFAGLDASACHFTRDNPEGRVDAITGATISSRAVTGAIAALLERISREKNR